MKVMVVDDSNTIRKSVETILSKVGCTVETAVDGYDALSKIAAACHALYLRWIQPDFTQCSGGGSGIRVSATLNRDPDYSWLFGELTWRGLTMPLVSFEQLLIQRNPRLRGSHIVILRSPAQVSRSPFFGVPVQAIPTPFSITDASQIMEGEDTGRLDLVARYVRVRGVDAVIPDLTAILDHMASCLAS